MSGLPARHGIEVVNGIVIGTITHPYKITYQYVSYYHGTIFEQFEPKTITVYGDNKDDAMTTFYHRRFWNGKTGPTGITETYQILSIELLEYSDVPGTI